MKRSEARDRLLDRMKQQQPAHSFITSYIAWLRTENPEGADLLEADIVQTFSSEQGLRVLKLMENCVLLAGVPNGAPESALREMNAVRNFVLEIRRLVANG